MPDDTSSDTKEPLKNQERHSKRAVERQDSDVYRNPDAHQDAREESLKRDEDRTTEREEHRAFNEDARKREQDRLGDVEQQRLEQAKEAGVKPDSETERRIHQMEFDPNRERQEEARKAGAGENSDTGTSNQDAGAARP